MLATTNPHELIFITLFIKLQRLFEAIANTKFWVQSTAITIARNVSRRRTLRHYFVMAQTSGSQIVRRNALGPRFDFAIASHNNSVRCLNSRIYLANLF